MNKEGAEPATFAVLGIAAAEKRGGEGHVRHGSPSYPPALVCCSLDLMTYISENRAMESHSS